VIFANIELEIDLGQVFVVVVGIASTGLRRCW